MEIGNYRVGNGVTIPFNQVEYLKG